MFRSKSISLRDRRPHWLSIDPRMAHMTPLATMYPTAYPFESSVAYHLAQHWNQPVATPPSSPESFEDRLGHSLSPPYASFRQVGQSQMAYVRPGSPLNPYAKPFYPRGYSAPAPAPAQRVRFDDRPRTPQGFNAFGTFQEDPDEAHFLNSNAGLGEGYSHRHQPHHNESISHPRARNTPASVLVPSNPLPLHYLNSPRGRAPTPGLFLHHEPPTGQPRHSAYTGDPNGSIVALPLPPKRTVVDADGTEIEFLSWKAAIRWGFDMSNIQFRGGRSQTFWRQIGEDPDLPNLLHCDDDLESKAHSQSSPSTPLLSGNDGSNSSEHDTMSSGPHQDTNTTPSAWSASSCFKAVDHFAEETTSAPSMDASILSLLSYESRHASDGLDDIPELDDSDGESDFEGDEWYD